MASVKWARSRAGLTNRLSTPKQMPSPAARLALVCPVMWMNANHSLPPACTIGRQTPKASTGPHRAYPTSTTGRIARKKPAVMSTSSQAMSRQVAGSLSSVLHCSSCPITPPESLGIGRYGSGMCTPDQL